VSSLSFVTMDALCIEIPYTQLWPLFPDSAQRWSLMRKVCQSVLSVCQGTFRVVFKELCNFTNLIWYFSLLSHEDDSHVADGALKCFASLADRFIRKNVDPMPLATHGLTKELLSRLSNAGTRIQSSSSGTPGGAGASSGQGSDLNFCVIGVFLIFLNIYYRE